MKNYCLLLVCGLMVGTLVAGIESAQAIAPFKKEFDEKYVKKDPQSPEEKSLAAAAAQAKCNICHKGTMKKERNVYGDALDALLDKKVDMKDTAKIQAALDKVAEMKSNPNDPSSPTFGELIKQGKLPGGEEAQAAAK